MLALALLAVVTALYAGYNLFMKLSGQQVPDGVSSTIFATITVQVAALLTSAVFLAVLTVRGGQVLTLTPGSLLWAAAAGVCIGGAEIGYLYLFGGIGIGKPMAASVVVPTVVVGTVLIALLFSHFVLREPLGWVQLGGAVLIVLGVICLFAGGSATAPNLDG